MINGEKSTLEKFNTKYPQYTFVRTSVNKWKKKIENDKKQNIVTGTTGKVEPSQQFLDEEKLTFQRNISTIIEDHDIPKDMILNLDQTPLSYVSPRKYTFNPKGAKSVPIKGVDDKRQITANLSISMTGSLLPIQLIYEGKTEDVFLTTTFQKVSTSRIPPIIGLTLKSQLSCSRKSYSLIRRTLN